MITSVANDGGGSGRAIDVCRNGWRTSPGGQVLDQEAAEAIRKALEEMPT